MTILIIISLLWLSKNVHSMCTIVLRKKAYEVVSWSKKWLLIFSSSYVMFLVNHWHCGFGISHLLIHQFESRMTESESLNTRFYFILVCSFQWTRIFKRRYWGGSIIFTWQQKPCSDMPCLEKKIWRTELRRCYKGIWTKNLISLWN